MDPSSILLRRVVENTNNSQTKKPDQSSTLQSLLLGNRVEKPYRKHHDKNTSRSPPPTMSSSSRNTVPRSSPALFEATTQLRSSMPIIRSFSLSHQKTLSSSTSSPSSTTSSFVFVDLFSQWQNQSQNPNRNSSSVSPSSSKDLKLIHKNISHISIFDEAFLLALSTLLNSSSTTSTSISTSFVGTQQKQSETQKKEDLSKVLLEVNKTAVATAENFLLWGIDNNQRELDEIERRVHDELSSFQHNEEEETERFSVANNDDDKYSFGDQNFVRENLEEDEEEVSRRTTSVHQLLKRKRFLQKKRESLSKLQKERETLVELVKSAQKLENLYLSMNSNIGLYIVVAGEKSTSSSSSNFEIQDRSYNTTINTGIDDDFLLGNSQESFSTQQQQDSFSFTHNNNSSGRNSKLHTQRKFVNTNTSNSNSRILLDFLFGLNYTSPQLSTFFAPSSLLGLLQFPSLKKLSLSSCGIRTFSTLAPIRFLPRLEHLSLEGNPICEMCQIFSSPNNYRNEMIRYLLFFGDGNNIDNTSGNSSSASSSCCATMLKSLDGKIITENERRKAQKYQEQQETDENIHQQRPPLPPKYLIELFQTSTLLTTVVTRLNIHHELKYGLANSRSSSSTTKKNILRKALRIVLLLTSLSRCPCATSAIFDLPSPLTSSSSSSNSLSTLNETCLLLLQTKITKQLKRDCVRQLKLSKSEQVMAAPPTFHDARFEVEQELRDSIEECITVIVENHIFGGDGDIMKQKNVEGQSSESVLDMTNHKPLIDGVADVCKRWPNLLVSSSTTSHDDATFDLSQLFIHGIPLYHDYFFNHYRAREIEQKFSDGVYQGIDSSVLMKFPRVADAVDLLYSDELNELQQRKNNNSNITNINEKSPSLSLPPLSSPARNLFFGGSNDTSLQVKEGRDQDGGEEDEFLPMMVMNESERETNHQHHHHDHSPPLATLTDDEEDDENLNPRNSSPPVRQEHHNTPSRTKRQEEEIIEGNNNDEEQVLDFEQETDTEEQDQQQQNELLETAADDFYHNGILKKSFLRWFNKWCTQFETSTQQIEFLQQSQSHFRLKNLFDKWIWRYDKAVWMKQREKEQREEEEREEQMKQMKMEQQKFLPPLSPKKKVGVDKDDTDNSKFENVGVLHNYTISDEQYRDRDDIESLSQLKDLESKVQQKSKLNLLSTTFRLWKTRLSHRMTDAVFRIAVQSSLEPTTIDYFVEEAPDAIDDVELDQSLKNASLSILYAVERKDHLLMGPPSVHDDHGNSIISRTSSSHSHHHNTSNAKLVLDCEDDIARNCIKRWRLKLADVRKKKMLSHQEDSRMENGDESTSSPLRQNQSPPLSSNRQQQQDSISPNFIERNSNSSHHNNTSPSAVATKMMRRARRQTWKAFCHRLQARHVLMIEEQRRRSNDNYSGYSSPRSSSSRVASPTQRTVDFPAMMNISPNENEKVKSSPSPQNPSVQRQQETETERRKLSSSSSGINPNNKKKRVVVTKRIKVKSKADHHNNTSSTNNPRLFSVSESTARNSVSPSASPEPKQQQQSNSQYSKNDDNNNDQRSSVSSSSVFVSEDLIELASKMLLSSSSNHNHDEKQIETEEEFILPPPQREQQNTNLLVEDISAIINRNNHSNNEKRTQGQVHADADDDDHEVERKAVNAIDNLHLDDVTSQRQKGNPLRNLNVVLAFHKLAESLAKNGKQ